MLIDESGKVRLHDSISGWSNRSNSMQILLKKEIRNNIVVVSITQSFIA